MSRFRSRFSKADGNASARWPATFGTASLFALSLTACSGSGADVTGAEPSPGTVSALAPSINAPPSIRGIPPSTATVGQAYVFQPSGADPDADRLVYDIAGKPRWAEFDTGTGRLQGTPTDADIGPTADISISVSDGLASATLEPFSIQVEPFVPPVSSVPRAAEPSTATPTPGETGRQNRAPLLWGAAPTSVRAGSSFEFQPSASDPDGDRLVFSIQNRPAWAVFDAATGTLSGRPARSDAGVASSIVIAVSDGETVTSLPPFSVRVVAENSAPSISGFPMTSIEVGSAYAFVPTATDADGDPLAFTVSNKPSWASFDPRSGRLSGTPTAADVGTFAGVGISVSDGRASDSLPAFTITVSASTTSSVILDWEPPTTNSDGTALTDLAGYRLRYGTTTESLDRSVEIPNASLSSFVVDGLARGTWYFVLRAYNRSGTEGLPSDVASAVLN